jgi:hypothetical protein
MPAARPASARSTGLDSTRRCQMIFTWVGRNPRLATDFEATIKRRIRYAARASGFLRHRHPLDLVLLFHDQVRDKRAENQTRQKYAPNSAPSDLDREPSKPLLRHPRERAGPYRPPPPVHRNSKPPASRLPIRLGQSSPSNADQAFRLKIDKNCGSSVRGACSVSHK